MISKEFLLSGKGVERHKGTIFTLEIPQNFQDENKIPAHYTYKLTYTFSSKWGEKWFLWLLAGPDNTSDYTYLGMMNSRSGEFIYSRKSPKKNWPIALVNRALVNIFNDTEERISAAGFEIHHVGKCGRCGRRLTVPESIKSGIGPYCKGKIK